MLPHCLGVVGNGGVHDLDRRQMAEIRPERIHEMRLRTKRTKAKLSGANSDYARNPSTNDAHKHALTRARTQTRAHLHLDEDDLVRRVLAEVLDAVVPAEVHDPCNQLVICD